jgi:hypothetical protein
MDPTLKYPILRTLLSPFRKSQQKTLALVIAAIVAVAQANSLSIAAMLAQWTGTLVASALNRFYRLLGNSRIDELAWMRQMLLCFPEQKRLLVAIDWTEWHHGLRILLASVVTGTRSIPIYAPTFRRRDIPRSQNCQENNLVRVLAFVFHQLGKPVVLLCDRGFRRVSFIRLLLAQHVGFVVRLQSDLRVHTGGRSRLLRNWHLSPGQAVDLGWIALRQDRAVVARVIGVWAPGQREPWWLVTNLDDSLPTVVALYDRRMTIEEQIRDTKGCRFGLRLEWTQFRTPAHLSRFMMLLGAVLLIWTAAGAAAVHRQPKLQLVIQQRPRLSLLTVGIRWIDTIRRTAHIGIEYVRSYLPPPTLRTFAWLNQ